jgi:endonuclease YncB( thermonuclease family)
MNKETTIADVFLPDGTNVNHTLVKDGWCWWYRNYAPGNTILERLENEANEGKKGLWVDSAPIPPWEWLKRAMTKRDSRPDAKENTAPRLR